MMPPAGSRKAQDGSLRCEKYLWDKDVPAHAVIDLKKDIFSLNHAADKTTVVFYRLMGIFRADFETAHDRIVVAGSKV